MTCLLWFSREWTTTSSFGEFLKSSFIVADQRLFFPPAPSLHLLLPRNRLVDVAEDAYIHQLHGSSFACVTMRVNTLLMLPESMQVVIGDSGVETSATTAEDVDEIRQKVESEREIEIEQELAEEDIPPQPNE